MEYFCCPAPTVNPDLEMNELTKRYRSVLKTIAYGEIGAVLGWGYVFGFLTGLIHLVHMWICYTAYATMNPCVVLVCVFCSGMELIELFMNANDGGQFQEAIFDT